MGYTTDARRRGAFRTRRPVWASMAMAGLALACRDGTGPSALVEPENARPRFAAAQASTKQSEIVPGQYIVTFAKSVGDPRGLAKQLAAQHGGSVRFTYTAALKGFAATLPEEAVEALQNNPNVASIEPDLIVRATDYTNTWGQDRIDQRALPLDYQFSPSASGAGVNVYIIDTGIRTTHTDFEGRAVGAFTSVSDGNGTNDCAGHGTHVAGTVGGRVWGVAKGVRLYSVRVLDCLGKGSWSQVIAGIDWVAANRVLPAVANMSLGGSASGSVNTAIQNATRAGVTFAVAAGNDGSDACRFSPASAAEAITVGATSSADKSASFSNYGPCLDINAPGVYVLSSWYTSDAATEMLSGTSMATPHVAGAAALYLQSHPSAQPSEVSWVLSNIATRGALALNGTGSPNLLLNITDIQNPPPPPVVSDQPPTASFTSSCKRNTGCTFDASASSDDRGIVTYEWSWGDGYTTITTSPVAAHAYPFMNWWNVTLVVRDASGQVGSSMRVLKG